MSFHNYYEVILTRREPGSVVQHSNVMTEAYLGPTKCNANKNII